MNYTELQAQIASYIHRNDLDAVIPGFIELAEARINRDLRVPEMQTEAVLNTINGIAQLPARYLDMRELWYFPGVRSWTLNSTGRHTLSRYRGLAGEPQVYSLQGTTIEIAPARDNAEFNLLFWQAEQPLSLVPTNAILDKYPYLYLYASLIEAAFYTQDAELAAGYQAKYEQDLAITNAEAAATRFGEAPTMSAN
ncbi:MAG: hypothetical protein GY727_00590 [Gammaproteobacteria bacterium]|nr:hypothetical protein [Gammaproteobacteria bacterium]MCP4090962.1 hypothetical protein [Gammaproteobacteria bacterium]MCP4275265.1 hypothetical protein [Gammaproteobacteria bacterium]MCP4929393.1 hypothetical protein [Gammaproteobacteria bacterium]